jgi:coenzyme F420 hydrogenase subunit beta
MAAPSSPVTPKRLWEAVMSRRLQTVEEVARWRLCLGCGACADVCPSKNVRLVDVVEEGIRPVVLDRNKCRACDTCVQICPAYENNHSDLVQRSGILPSLARHFGPVLEIWEGHACDEQIHFAGSSGGVLTGLALHCLQHLKMHGVLHIGGNPHDPLRNQTTMSRTRDDLLRKTGSRYAPASACDALHLIEQAPEACVFIGQPAEVTALRKAQALRPALQEKVGLALSFFCAGSPSTQGTLQLLRALGVDPAQVTALRYRGLGWPGLFSATLRGQNQPSAAMTYREAWAFLQQYRPYATHLTPDGTGEDADISCGDPWYREPRQDEAGSSLILVRTELGRQILQSAVAAGYVQIQPSTTEKLVRSQKGLIEKRGAIWGRVLAFRLLGLPAPRLRGFNLWRSWLALPWRDRARSILGTLRRIAQRRYYLPEVRAQSTFEEPKTGP